MDENLVKKLIEDLDRISKKIEEIQARLKVEKKEQRKMWQVINTMAQLSSAHPTGEVYWHQLASATIDAVIECYEDYMSSPRKIDFKNWLTQRLL